MRTRLLVPIAATLFAAACARPADQPADAADVDLAQQGQAAVGDSTSQPDVVKVAAGSKDHTTLVAALKAADLVNSLANAGPFTVFAPVNAAFDKLPRGTVDDLLKPENKGRLAGVLQHHVAVPVIDLETLESGQTLGMADGGRVTVTKQDGRTLVNGATVLATVRASNGVVYVIDGVLVP